MATIVDRKKQLESLSKKGKAKIKDKKLYSKFLYLIDEELKSYKRELEKKELESEYKASKIRLTS